MTLSADVLSGGGEKGAYQAGAELYFAEQGHDPEALLGVSVGGMGSAFLCQYGFGKFREGCERLCELWTETETRDVVKQHFPPYLGIPWKGSVYDSSPHRKLIRRWIDPKKLRSSGRQLRTVSVDWRTKKRIIGKQSSPDIIEHVIATSSFPLLMEAVQVGGHDLVTDGGLRDVTPIKHAIELGASKVHVVMCSSPEVVERWEPAEGIWRFASFAARAVDILVAEVIETDLKVCGLKNELAQLNPKYKVIDLKIVRPTKSLGTGSLEFSKNQAVRLIERGYADAREAS